MNSGVGMYHLEYVVFTGSQGVVRAAALFMFVSEKEHILGNSVHMRIVLDELVILKMGIQRITTEMSA